MIRIIGERGSGKTTELLKLAHENGYILVEPTPRMATFAEMLAREKGYKDVKILYMSQFVMRDPGLFVKDQDNRYLIDELDLSLAMMNVAGYSISPDVSSWEKDYRSGRLECVRLNKEGDQNG